MILNVKAIDGQSCAGYIGKVNLVDGWIEGGERGEIRNGFLWIKSFGSVADWYKWAEII